MAYDPAILKWTKQAAKELWAFHYDKKLSTALRQEIVDLVKVDVIGSGMTVHDIPDITNLADFEKLMEAMRGEKIRGVKAIKRFWTGTKNFTTWRENVLRLAAFRHFQAQLRKGKQVFGASDPDKVRAIGSQFNRAALLARELVGDYGGLSKSGRWTRRKLIPFYSWAEINAPRYWRIIKNLPIEGEARGGRLRVGAVLGKKAAFTTAKIAMFYTLVQLFNHLVWPDEEEELGATGRRQMHLILGRRADGSIITMRIQGAFSDALSWLGAEDLPQDIRDVKAGRKTATGMLGEAALAPVQKVVQGIRPDVKVPFELMTGKTLYPDMTRPRPIRDKAEHVARLFSLDAAYRRLAGKPSREAGMFDKVLGDLGRTVVYTADPGEAAYHDIRGLAFKYLEKQNIERPQVEATSKSNALYYYRQAIKYGDGEAAQRYLDDYRRLGGNWKGLRISVKRAHPLAMLPKTHRYRFTASLSGEDRALLNRATSWYRQTYIGREGG